MSITASRRSRLFTSRCSASDSPIWLPMVCSGESAVIGSWKMIEMRPPRMSCIARPAGSRRDISTSEACFGSRKTISPDSMRALRGRMPMIDCATTDLPEPDSPTSATVPPAGMRNDTPSTALTTPASTSRCTLRSRTVMRSAIGRRSIREGLRRREPAHSLQGEKSFEEIPGRRVMHRVVREPADGLAGGEPLDRLRQRLLFPHEVPAAPPRHHVDVRVDLPQARRRLAALLRPIRADAADADARKLIEEVRAHAVPRWCEHRNKFWVGYRAQLGHPAGDSLQRGSGRLGGRIFGLLLPSRRAVAVIRAVLQDGDPLMQTLEEVGRCVLRDDGEREGNGVLL